MTDWHTRTVVATIDAGGVYSSRVAAGGGYVFLAGTAIDDTARLAEAASPRAPYEGSAAAQARMQTRYIFEQYRELLPHVGSSLHDIVQLEQYVKLKVHTDGYFREALGPGFMDTSRPVGATAQVGDYFPEGAVVSITGLAIVPDQAAGRVKTFPGLDPNKPGGQFPQNTAAGPYFFTTYYPTDSKTGIDPAVRTEDWNWRGSEIRNEAEYGIEVMKQRLAIVGASLSDIVDYTLFLADTGDLYEFDLVFRRALGPHPPARTVIPIRGLANPRREGAFGHEQGALRMEAQFRCLRPGQGVEKVVVPGPGDEYGHQSAGIRVGPLLWMSSQVADEPYRGQNAAQQIENIFDKIAATCRNGETSLGNLLRLRALLTRPEDAWAVFAALRRVVPSAPPAVCIIVVPAPLPLAGCSVALDAVAYVGGA
jgi:enamine deaminase RidA (YjgF/YER057c/UK114 family)